jgi:hypothetical protein
VIVGCGFVSLNAPGDPGRPAHQPLERPSLEEAGPPGGEDGDGRSQAAQDRHTRGATMDRVASLCGAEARIPAGVSPKMPMLSGDTDDMPCPLSAFRTASAAPDTRRTASHEPP